VSFFGNLLKIIAIGAFFIATGPFGLAVGNTLATALRIGGVVLSYLGALIDKPRLLSDRQKIVISTTLEPGTPLPVVYGRAKVGAIVADWFIQPDNSFKELYYIAVLCHGSRDDLGIAGVDEIWLDQRRAINVAVPNPYPFTIGRFFPYKIIAAGYKVFLGSTTQNVGATRFYTDGTGGGIEAPADVAGSGWSLTTDTGKGICCIGFVFVNVDTSVFAETPVTITSSSVAGPTVITTATAHSYNTGESVRITGHSGSTPSLNADWVIVVTGASTFTIPEIVTVGGSGGTAKRFAEGPVFHGPPSVAAIVRGNRIYDSRTDLWVAGGDNPSLVIRDYLLAPIYGCGLSQALIHEQSFKDAADVCDVVVTYVTLGVVNITSSSVANPSVITTATPHGWITGTLVRIAGHTGSTPAINNDYTITVTGASTFTIPVNVTVGGTGGTATKLIQAKRFTCNGVLDTARSTSDNLQELLSSCRGNLVWEQGQFKLTIRSPAVASPTLTLDPSNILGDWSFRNAGLDEKWNIVKASYVEPANGEFKVQDVQWPIVGTTNNYLTADGAFTNTLELSLPFTNNQLMAQAIAQVTLNEARFGITAQVRCTEAALAASVGDRVYVTHPTPSWTQKQFWVTALQLLPDTSVGVSLQEYDATAYDLATVEDQRSYVPFTPDLNIPPVGAVTGTSITAGGLLISWVSPKYGLTDYYEVQARCSSCGDSYTTIAAVKGGRGEVTTAVAPLARSGQTWYAQVRIVDLMGRPGPWTESSAIVMSTPVANAPGTGSIVFTGIAPTVAISMTAPTINSVTRTQIAGGNACIFEDNWTHRIDWDTSGADDVNFQVDIDVASDAAGTSYGSLVTALTTVDSSYTHDTGVSGNTGGATNPVPYYRKYKVKIVRKSDSAVISSLNTTQGTLTTYTDMCIF
jgi:putative tail protein